MDVVGGPSAFHVSKEGLLHTFGCLRQSILLRQGSVQHSGKFRTSHLVVRTEGVSVGVELHPQVLECGHFFPAPVVSHVVKGRLVLQQSKAVVQQGGTVGVAGLVVGGLHYHADDAAAIFHSGGTETVASGGDGARLEAVRAVIGVVQAGQQFVGVGVPFSIEGDPGEGGIVQNLREAMDEFPDQSGLGAGGEIVDVSAVGAFIFRCHTQARGGLIHPLDKGLLTAGDILSHNDAAGAGEGIIISLSRVSTDTEDPAGRGTEAG